MITTVSWETLIDKKAEVTTGSTYLWIKGGFPHTVDENIPVPPDVKSLVKKLEQTLAETYSLKVTSYATNVADHTTNKAHRFGHLSQIDRAGQIVASVATYINHLEVSSGNKRTYPPAQMKFTMNLRQNDDEMESVSFLKNVWDLISYIQADVVCPSGASDAAEIYLYTAKKVLRQGYDALPIRNLKQHPLKTIDHM